MLSVASAHIALPVNFSSFCFPWRRERTGGGQSPPPPVPRAPASKIAAARSFDLSLQASGRAEVASMQNTALSPHPCGLPRPAGNVSAILRPPVPAVSAAPALAPAVIWGCRPGKALAATRQKNRRSCSMPLRRHFLRPSGITWQEQTNATAPRAGSLRVTKPTFAAA